MRMKLIYAFIALVCLGFGLVNTPLAQEAEPVQESTSNPLLDSKITYTVDERVISLFDERGEIAGDEATILALIVDEMRFNYGERYLLYYALALSQIASNKLDQVEESFNKAISFEEFIGEEQLIQPSFARLYLAQSEFYERQGNYKLAYDQRRTYGIRAAEFSSSANRLRIGQLQNKYKTQIKQNNNELLKSQNALKELQLEDIARKERQQQYVIWSVTIIIVIFVSLIIRQIQIRKKLKKLSETDTLTGLSNRKVLFEKGYQLITQAQQQERKLSVLIFDLDHFKSINDEYGHHVGDQVLIEVATLAKEAMRSRDLLVRFGGEEFIAILPDASIGQAKAMAERLREKIAQHQFSSPLVNQQVTTSIGITMLTPESEFDVVIHQADIAMYQAKLAGRNIVLGYQPEMEDKSTNYRQTI